MRVSEDCRPVVSLLPEYVDDDLATDEHLAVRDHLRSCNECRARERGFRQVGGLMSGAIGPRVLSKDFLEETGKRLAKVTAEPTADEAEEDVVEPAPASFVDALTDRMGAAPWWIISGAFHALVLLLVTLIGMALLRSNTRDVVIVTDLAEQKEPEEEEKPKERAVFEQPVEIETPEISEETPILTHEEVEIAEHLETADDSDAADARGDDGISDVFLGGSGTVAAIGLGGGGGGAFGRPNGAGGRLRRAIRGGGGKATESAVDAALAWLARHQEADGHWDIKKYEGGNVVSGGRAYDEGVSALALLAFLGAGHTERIGKYKEVVRKAQDWLISRQDAVGDGNVYHSYSLALSTLALAESYAMGRNPKIGEAAQKGLDHVIKTQQPHGGWNHGSYKSTSVMGWFVMAIKSAKVAGFKVPNETFERAIKRFEAIGEKDADGYWGQIGYVSRAKSPYCKGMSMTAVGMVSLQFLGLGGETAKQGDILIAEPPKWEPNAGVSEVQNFYHWYYGTLGMFQLGGGHWKRWNESLKSTLLPSQRKGGPKDGSVQDVDGSWDPTAGWAPTGGRVYSTAMGALCLEVYYRYLPLYR